jgi:hypothetical protein
MLSNMHLKAATTCMSMLTLENLLIYGFLPQLATLQPSTPPTMAERVETEVGLALAGVEAGREVEVRGGQEEVVRGVQAGAGQVEVVGAGVQGWVGQVREVKVACVLKGTHTKVNEQVQMMSVGSEYAAFLSNKS